MKSPNLLVVDGDPVSLGLMTEMFGSLKSNVCPVSDGLKAAALINEKRFDGIFLDIELADKYLSRNWMHPKRAMPKRFSI